MYLVDAKSAERSRNHPTKLKAYRRAELRAERRKKKRDKAKSESAGFFAKPVHNVGFYDSQEWKEVRYKVLQKYGARCQCCGSTRHDGVRIHVDHIKPRSRYPGLELDINNLQVLCEPCNMGKRAHDCTDWR